MRVADPKDDLCDRNIFLPDRHGGPGAIAARGIRSPGLGELQ